MRLDFVPRLPPIDRVVAAHLSTGDAATSIESLRQAGFSRRMLAVVAHDGATIDVRSLAAALPARQRDWADSGLLCGALWAALTVAATSLLEANASSLAWLFPIGGAALALHLRILAGRMAARTHEDVSLVSSAHQAAAGTDETIRRNHYLVVVNAGRGEVATAREVLANRAFGKAHAG